MLIRVIPKMRIPVKTNCDCMGVNGCENEIKSSAVLVYGVLNFDSTLIVSCNKPQSHDIDDIFFENN